MRQTTHTEGFPGGSDGREPSFRAGDAGSIPGSARSPGEEMEAHSDIPAGKSHGQRSLVGYNPWGP